MNTPKFSVAMCVYGGDNPEWFELSVESILNQTVKPNEVVLVVDGPVPQELDEIINKYSQREDFKVIRFAENQGHGNARRESLKHCSNDLVALMDADDISLQNRFELQLAEFSKDNELSIVGGNITEFCGAQENIVGRRSVPCSDAQIKEYLKSRCPMNQVTVMFKKSHVDDVGGYIDWFCEEDYYLWIRMHLKGMKFANVPQVLCNVRVGEDMYRRRGGWKYFKSEAKLQKYMMDEKIIGFAKFIVNVAKRFIVQVMLPNSIRGWVFKKFAREQDGE